MKRKGTTEMGIVRDAINAAQWMRRREERIAVMQALVDSYRRRPRGPLRVPMTDELRFALRRAVAAASAAGITHGQLARRIGLGRSTLVRYLYHFTMAHRSRLVALVEVLKAENLPVEPLLLAA